MAEPSAHPLADPDGDEEIADRDAALGGRQAVHVSSREHSSIILSETLPGAGTAKTLLQVWHAGV